jgi:hypothetical protein
MRVLVVEQLVDDGRSHGGASGTGGFQLPFVWVDLSARWRSVGKTCSAREEGALIESTVIARRRGVRSAGLYGIEPITWAAGLIGRGARKPTTKPRGSAT